MTKPNQEGIACENLKRQAFEHYCPRFIQCLPNKSPTVRPLFPRYLFVFITEQWYPIRSTRGVSKVLMGDTSPQTLGESYIEELKLREDDKGFFQLTKPDRFKVGDRVKTDEGPFAGHFLIYEGMQSQDRVSCLFSVLGCQRRTWLAKESLVAA